MRHQEDIKIFTTYVKQFLWTEHENKSLFCSPDTTPMEKLMK